MGIQAGTWDSVAQSGMVASLPDEPSFVLSTDGDAAVGAFTGSAGLPEFISSDAEFLAYRDALASKADEIDTTGITVTGAARSLFGIGGNGGDVFDVTVETTAEIYGGEGDDRLSSSGGSATLNGAEGDDTLHGGTGGDSLRGGDNDDLIFASGSDTLWGGDGVDIVAFAASGGVGVDVELVDSVFKYGSSGVTGFLQQIERVIGTGFVGSPGTELEFAL